ncbi:MAG: hypothetical protein WC516_03205 [Patescibacteria group bacterium]
MLIQIIAGLIGCVIGFFMVWKPHIFLEMIGEQQWAEKFFGQGNGTTAYKVIGMVIIVVSFLVITGLFKGVIVWFFGPLFNGYNQ